MLGVLGALVGSRLAAGLLSHSVDLAAMLRGQSGAMSWGAYAGGLVAASARVCAGRGRWLRHVDAAAPAVLLGIAIARLGCFAEGDDFGTVCHYAWCVQFGATSDAYAVHRTVGWISAEANRSLPVHPLQLYFSATAAAAAVVVLWVERRWGAARTDGARAGSTALLALLLYTMSRAPLESFRETAGRDANGVSSTQVAALQLCLALALLLAWRVREELNERVSSVRGDGGPAGTPASACGSPCSGAPLAYATRRSCCSSPLG